MKESPQVPYETPIICRLQETLPQAEECRKRYSLLIIQQIEARGFTHVSDLTNTQNQRGAHPDFIAAREGKTCYIFMPPVADSVMNITHLSTAQCQSCEQDYSGYDIYFAATYLASNDEYKLLAPVLIRRNGQWLHDARSEQFLPFCMRNATCGFAALLGGAHVFKLVCVVLPLLVHLNGKARFRVTGMSPQNEYREPEPPYTVLLAETNNAIFALMLAAPGDTPTLVRPCFYHEELTYSELELVSVAHHEHHAMVKLLSRTGIVLRGESLDALVIPQYVPANRRYMWSLSLVAESCTLNATAPDYHCDPAAPTDSMVTGYITELHQRRVCERPLTVAVLRIDSEVSICVYLAPEIIGGYHPAIGDLLSCKGLLQAAPRNTEQGESWQDSPEIALSLHKREQERLADSIYHKLAGASHETAAVAAAFVRAGWRFLSAEGSSSLSFSNQLGEHIRVGVNTSTPPADCTHICQVSLYEGDRQARLTTTPPIPGIPDSLNLPAR